MNLSKDTLILIKNFSGINGSLMLQAGSRLATISEGRNVMAEATIVEEFPMDFGIYDVGEFLNAMNIFSTPQLDFSEKFVTISDGDSKIKYFAAGSGIVKAAPATINFPEPEVNFLLQAQQLATMLKTASVLKTSDISILGDGVSLKALVADKKNSTANAYDVTLAHTSLVFQANFKTDSLRNLLPGAYEVSLSSKKISRFKNATMDLTYYVAVESDSEFNG